MRHIVVYKIIMAIGFFTWMATAAAQKPAIDLISSNKQNRHPEAIIDTCFAINPEAQKPVLLITPPAQDQHLKEEPTKKKHRQIGPSLDSIFQKNENSGRRQEKSKAKVSLFNRKFKPLKMFIYVIALN